MSSINGKRSNSAIYDPTNTVKFALPNIPSSIARDKVNKVANSTFSSSSNTTTSQPPSADLYVANPDYPLSDSHASPAISPLKNSPAPVSSTFPEVLRSRSSLETVGQKGGTCLEDYEPEVTTSSSSTQKPTSVSTTPENTPSKPPLTRNDSAATTATEVADPEDYTFIPSSREITPLPSPERPPLIRKNTLIQDFLNQNQWTIIKEVGSGCCAQVFEIELNQDPSHTKKVIKIIHPKILKNPTTKKYLKAEGNKGEVNSTTIKHPSVLSSLELIKNSDNLVVGIIMPLFENSRSLDAFVASNALENKKLLSIALQIAGGVAHLHKNSIAHRDLKPENILINQEGIVKIIDFGVSIKITEKEPLLRRTNSFVGTLNYFCPEKLESTYDPIYADLWAMGVVFYNLAFNNQFPSTPLQLPKDSSAPKPFLEIIEQLMQKEDHKRLAAQEVYERLLKMENDEGVNASRASPGVNGSLN